METRMEILECCVKPMKVTHIMTSTNSNFVTLMKHIHFLMQRGFLEFTTDMYLDDERVKGTYQTTFMSHAVIRQYKELKKMILE